MNTRLQVEHTVTEMVTGLDLVEWQLRVAAGEPLPLRQEEVRLEGHAIEARLYAEDPYAGFAPQTGPVLHFRPEAARGPGIRIDAGIAEGSEVSPFYDPMVAKVIAHGRDRDDAIRRLRAALERHALLGPATNGRFLRDLLDHESFRNAAMHTTLIDEWLESGEAILQRPRPGSPTGNLPPRLFAGTIRAGARVAWPPKRNPRAQQSSRLRPDADQRRPKPKSGRRRTHSRHESTAPNRFEHGACATRRMA
jgi:acetyl/propionyl-CoA carboxylase alpha subunit